MNIISLIIGIILILFTISSVVWSIFTTPDNLRGFYGFKFFLIALFGIIGGIVLIIFAI